MTNNETGSLLVIKGSRQYAFESEQIRIAVEHVGLSVRVFNVDEDSPDDISLSVRHKGTLAVIIAADALVKLNRERVLADLYGPEGKRKPVMVFGIRPAEDASEVLTWSAGAIQTCNPVATSAFPEVMEVLGPADITGTLGGMQIPTVIVPTCSLGLSPSSEQVLTLRSQAGSTAALVLVSDGVTDHFFAPEFKCLDKSWVGKTSTLPQAFCSVAPFLLFIRHAAGEFGWHLDGAYANFTIDDPWLTQPYGSLDYPRLLSEMLKHSFHTTIAFVPWNYDRSASPVVKLFRDHPDRYSICIHGNDHNHQEFGDYKHNPLAEQVANIKQGVARMEAFHKVTGIPYDRFMVFPHSVAPVETFEALKQREFLGTANSSNVPLGQAFPSEPGFLLRPYTNDYGDLLSIFRYSAENLRPLELAIHAFLGNPLLFYSHQDLFHKGIDAFNKVADFANRIAPCTKWVGLGELAKHLHLLRRRQDNSFDVRMISSELLLTNPADSTTTFHIRHAQKRSGVIRSVAVDGSVITPDVDDTGATFQVVLPPRHRASIRINYNTGSDVSIESITKRSVHSYTVRYLSDFRDLYLSKTSFGQRLALMYYRLGLNGLEVKLERKIRALFSMKQPSRLSGPAPE